MFQKCISYVRVATLVAALAAAPMPVLAGGNGAHGGNSYHGGYSHGGYGGYYHGGNGYYHNGFYGVNIGIGLYPGWGYGYGYGWNYPLYYPSGAIAGDAGYYNAPAPQPYIGPQPAPGASPAAVEVHVPADAQVWFDDLQTRQSGDVRLFETPTLDSGKNGHYTVRARWTENGRDVELTRQVNVQAGRRTLVDFLRPEAELLPSPKD
jgi:uncharacterized protein (TIGR03000 family)